MKANLLIIITLTLTICSQLWAAPNDTAVKKELPAVKMEHPPTIDGVL